MENHYTNVQVTASPQKSKFADPINQPAPFAPVLGRKNYTETLGRTRRIENIDDMTQLIHETRPQMAAIRQSLVSRTLDQGEDVSRQEIVVNEGPS